MKIKHFLQHALSNITGWLSRQPVALIVQPAIRWFIKQYKVNMSEAANSDISTYKTFNDFFTRALKPACRPIDSNPMHLAAPCDSQWLQAAPCQDSNIFAKGAQFNCSELLAHDQRAKDFTNGAFANFYLSPKDYHRVHMPLDGKLQAMTYVPGCLYSVDPKRMPQASCIYSANERLICYFQTALGPMAMVLVGALNVGSIETVWQKKIPRASAPQHWNYTENQPELKKGEEMGRFNLGSTVILCLSHIPADWQGQHQIQPIKYGENISIKSSH